VRLAAGAGGGEEGARAAGEALAAEVAEAAGAPPGGVLLAGVREGPTVDLVVDSGGTGQMLGQGDEQAVAGAGRGAAAAAPLGARVVARLAELLWAGAGPMGGETGAGAGSAVCVEIWGPAGPVGAGAGAGERSAEEWMALVESQTEQVQAQTASLGQLEDKVWQLQQALEQERLHAEAREEEASHLNFDLSQVSGSNSPPPLPSPPTAPPSADLRAPRQARFDLADARAAADKWRDAAEKAEAQLDEHRAIEQVRPRPLPGGSRVRRVGPVSKRWAVVWTD